MDNAGFNAQQMMQNGRPPQGMPPQMVQDSSAQAHANALLWNNGINPANLSDNQFISFQQQNPQVQQKSIQVYAQNLAKNQREGMSKAGGMSDGGSPMMADGMMGNPGPEYFSGPNGQMMRAGGMGPGANGQNGNHALQDYQMQLMLLEQQNKKRLLMARQEQDAPGQPGMPGPFAPGMSPQGSRGGPSPGPNGERRGTPKLGQPGMDGSPVPDGSMRGSPAAIPFNQMPMSNPEMFAAQMNGMRPPPSSNPAFAGQFNPQQMEAMQRQANAAQRGGAMPNGNWPQGPQGQAPMGQHPPPQQQPAQVGTPQQRNDMPPPQGPPPGAANGRTGSDDAPPTPQPTNKANPKKKEGKPKVGDTTLGTDSLLIPFQKQVKKNSTSVAATPASEAENPPATPTPSTPITASHPNSFNAKTEAPPANAPQAGNAAPVQQNAAPPPDMNAPSQYDANANGLDVSLAKSFRVMIIAKTTKAVNFDGNFELGFPDGQLLDNFSFDEFLDPSSFQFDSNQQMEDGAGMMDAQMNEAV